MTDFNWPSREEWAQRERTAYGDDSGYLKIVEFKDYDNRIVTINCGTTA